MSLTAKQLLEKAKPRFEWVQVKGWGKVGIRSRGKLLASQREASYRDMNTGELIPEELVKADLHVLIDQVMKDEKTPMFSDDNLQALGECDEQLLIPLYDAITKFNGGNGRGKPSTG